MICSINLHDEEVRRNEHRKPTAPIFGKGGGSMRMPAVAYVLAGFMAGLFVMTVINLYKYIVKVMSQ